MRAKVNMTEYLSSDSTRDDWSEYADNTESYSAPDCQKSHQGDIHMQRQCHLSNRRFHSNQNPPVCPIEMPGNITGTKCSRTVIPEHEDYDTGCKGSNKNCILEDENMGIINDSILNDPSHHCKGQSSPSCKASLGLHRLSQLLIVSNLTLCCIASINIYT